MENLDFSVVIPTYNRSKYVGFSIISALLQKKVTVEIIVIDDGNDNTKEIIKSLNDKRIRYIKNKKRLGYGLNVKKCFSKAKGTFIFTLGDDDIILDENTLYSVKKVMNKYKVGLGKIAGFSYKDDPYKPVKSFVLSNKHILLKPTKTDEIIFKTFDFNLGFYSGLIFVNAWVDKKKFIDHMGHAYIPVVFDLVKKHGFLYIPGHFILARLSYDMMPTYFNLEKYGSFFVEDLFFILDKHLSMPTAREYKDKYIRGWLSFLPHIQYFSSYENVVHVIGRLIKLDRRILFDPKLYIYGVLAFTPKPILLLMRNILLQKSTREAKKILAGYPYEKFVETIFDD